MKFVAHFDLPGITQQLSPFPPPLRGRVREGGTPREVCGCGTPFPQPFPARGKGAHLARRDTETHTSTRQARPLMRVVGGRLQGRNLASPASREIRPTADRLRESVFNILVHAYDDPIEGARVLDLFAGTGALGIEATSRGAAFTLFVDNGAEARALLRNNVEALGLGGVTKVYRRDATNLGPAHPKEPFSLVFLDPPYGKGLADKALASLRDGGWLMPGALLVVEEAKAAAFAAPEGFEELERRAYDDTEFVFLKLSG